MAGCIARIAHLVDVLPGVAGPVRKLTEVEFDAAYQPPSDAGGTLLALYMLRAGYVRQLPVETIGQNGMFEHAP